MTGMILNTRNTQDETKENNDRRLLSLQQDIILAMYQ